MTAERIAERGALALLVIATMAAVAMLALCGAAGLGRIYQHSVAPAPAAVAAPLEVEG